jgi:hypothetical protein
VTINRLNFSITNPNTSHGEAGAHPSEKGSLVGSMIAVAADHEYLMGHPKRLKVNQP